MTTQVPATRGADSEADRLARVFGPNPDRRYLGEADKQAIVRDLRDRHGLSVRAIAERSGISKSAVQRYLANDLSDAVPRGTPQEDKSDAKITADKLITDLAELAALDRAAAAEVLVEMEVEDRPSGRAGASDVSRPDLTDRERARAGPRALKTVGSPEWCWQTVAYFKDSLRHVDEQWREAEAVLADLVKARAWEVIPPEKPYGSKSKMVKAETGLSWQALRARIEQAKLTNHGGDRRSTKFQVDTINLNQGGTSESYIVRRLKRDRPDLAELVLDGKVSARAAGIAAGFVPRTATVPIDDPDRLAATLRRRLTPAALDRLRELLG